MHERDLSLYRLLIHLFACCLESRTRFPCPLDMCFPENTMDSYKRMRGKMLRFVICCHSLIIALQMFENVCSEKLQKEILRLRLKRFIVGSKRFFIRYVRLLITLQFL